MDFEREVIANVGMAIFLNPRLSCGAPERKKTLQDLCLEQFS